MRSAGAWMVVRPEVAMVVDLWGTRMVESPEDGGQICGSDMTSEGER